MSLVSNSSGDGFTINLPSALPTEIDATGPFQMQVSALAYDSYVGVIGVGRITRGTLKPGQQVVVKTANGAQR